MPICVIPPQSAFIQTALWNILNDHHLKPEPLGDHQVLTLEGAIVRKYLEAIPDEPFHSETGLYRFIPLKVDLSDRAARTLLKSVRDTIVEESGRVALWVSGVRRRRQVSGARVRFREVAILPLDTRVQQILRVG